MRRILFFILFLAFGCQQTTVNGQQSFSESENLKTAESESWLNSQSHKVARPQNSCLSDSKILRPYDFYENQIRFADSLYKNYLPQYNFEEVKAAMEFFDSVQMSAISRQCWRLFDEKATDENMLIAESRLLTAAKAHYYHAVGLTERDDIVGACEHYLRALEIMENETENLRTSKSESILAKDKRLKSKGKEKAHGSQLIAHSPEYEKIRFLALTYTRLGRLFLNENYCDLALIHYKSAYDFLAFSDDSVFMANTLKHIGNVHHLLNNQDSALYYYDRSLEVGSSYTNRLDIEKSIAQILFDMGEKDRAYVLIKSNMDKLGNYGEKESYYAVLGEMYYKDMEYDSAIFYLEKSALSENYYIRSLSSAKLSAIYDSIENQGKKAYYDNIISDLSVRRINKIVENNKLQNVYDIYKERRNDAEESINRRRMNLVVLSLVILVSAVIMLSKYVYNRKRKEFADTLKEKDENIADKSEAISRITEEIRMKDNELESFRQTMNDRDNLISVALESLEMRKKEISDKVKIIEKQKVENVRIKREKSLKRRLCLENYYESDICKKILDRKENEYQVMSTDELASLLESADKNLDGYMSDLTVKYPQLTKEDLYIICLTLLNVSKNGIAFLLGRSRKNIWEKTNRIKNVVKIGGKKDLFIFLKSNISV